MRKGGGLSEKDSVWMLKSFEGFVGSSNRVKWTRKVSQVDSIQVPMETP